MSLPEFVEVSSGAPDPASITPSIRRAAMLEHPTLAAAVIVQGRVQEANAPWRALFAVPTDVSVESHVATLFPNAGSADRFERNLEAAFAEPSSGNDLTARCEYPLMRHDGCAFVAEIVIRLFAVDNVDHPLNGDAVWQVRDISVERALRRELRELDDYHRELSRYQWELTFVVDREGWISFASPSTETTLGYRPHTLLARPFASLLDPEHAADAERWLHAAMQRPHSDLGESTADGYSLHFCREDGQRRVLACRSHECFDTPLIAGLVVHGRDITGLAGGNRARGRADDDSARTDRTAMAEPSANRDPLTGLPDRLAAEAEIARRAARLAGDDVLVAFVVDLDRMRDVNEGRGLDVGDAVIARTADILLQVAQADGFVARLGGDEFLVLRQGIDTQGVVTVAQALVDDVGDAGDDLSDSPRVEASVGVARLPHDGDDPSELLVQADTAMREAKRRGGSQAFIFNQRMAGVLRLRKALDADIEEALERKDFTMFYQPQLALGTGEVVGLEALLRWKHPTRGLLLPGVFIGAAFQRGLIDTITKLVLGQVCEQIAAWRRAGDLPDLPVTVNVSGRQFHDRRLPALVASALLKSGLPARLLVLEITEQSLAGEDAAIERVVKELSHLGILVAISDFNVGHASFRYQKQLRVSQVKLDRGFVNGLPHETESAIVVKALIEMAHHLNYQVIAECVETREQYEHLRAAGCDAGQGFYFGAPLSAVEIRAYLQSKEELKTHAKQSNPATP